MTTIQKTWRDRFGPLPEAAQLLLMLAEIKLAANVAKITRIEVRDNKVMLTRTNDFILLAGKFPRLASATSPARLVELLALLKKF